MEYISLKNSNLKVSKLCLGCMSFGEADQGAYKWTLPYEESKEIIHKAYEAGINFFDTSNNYSNGTSEIFLGKAIKDFKREDLVIATKCYFNEGKLSYNAIHNEIEKSLKRLNTDYIDLYILHRFDYDTPVYDTLKALNEEIAIGRIRNYGVSSMYGHQLAEYCYTSKEYGFKPFTTLQNHYSLIYREDERDLIPVAEKFNISRTPFAPYAAGRLTRKEYSSDSIRFTLDSKEGTRYDNSEIEDRKIVERVYELSLKYDCSMANICLAWEFYKGNDSILIGVTKQKHLLDALNCFKINLSEEDVNYLEELYIPHKINCNR